MGIYLKVKTCFVLELDKELSRDYYSVSNMKWSEIKEELGSNWISIEDEDFWLNEKVGNIVDVVETNTFKNIKKPLLTILPKDSREYYRMDDLMDQIIIPEGNRFNIKYIHWDFLSYNTNKIVTKTGEELEGDLKTLVGKDSYKKDFPDKIKKELIKKGIGLNKPLYEQYHTKAINRVLNMASYLGVPSTKHNYLRAAIVTYES